MGQNWEGQQKKKKNCGQKFSHYRSPVKKGTALLPYPHYISLWKDCKESIMVKSESQCVKQGKIIALEYEKFLIRTHIEEVPNIQSPDISAVPV